MAQLNNKLDQSLISFVQELKSLNDLGELKLPKATHKEIETDINGDSGFELSWLAGDIILFKEFGGEMVMKHQKYPLKIIR